MITVKYTAAFEDHSTRVWTLPNVPEEEATPNKLISRMNAYNDIWGWSLPAGAPRESISAEVEEQIELMKEVFVSTGGESLASIESATVISETEEVIYSG